MFDYPFLQCKETFRLRCQLQILGLIGLSLFSYRIAAEPVRTANNSIAMAILSPLPSKPSVLGSVPEIKSNHISSDYGSRIGPFTGQHEHHLGLDIPAQFGSPILAAGKGTVTYAAYAPGYGNLVEIDHGQGVMTRYGHADRLLVKVGAIVEQSQVIATVGNTGKSTGPHLHFEVSKGGLSIDPKLLFAIEGKPSSSDAQRYTFIFKEIKLKAPNQIQAQTQTQMQAQMKMNPQASNKQVVVYTSTATRKTGEPLVIVRAPAGKVSQ